ncbi:retrovirus-related pol polyprotein from transposon TNT 1-94 [Tanacetum coccineum]
MMSKSNKSEQIMGLSLEIKSLSVLCDEKGISQNFSSTYTPEQNGVAERKNITLIDVARTMMNGSVLSKHFWTEVSESLKHQGWVNAMQEELNQFYRNKVWIIIPLPRGKSVIGSKWVFMNKKDKLGNVIRNKAKLITHGYSQEEGIDYDETFAPVIRMEAIKIFLAYATYMNFNVFQVDEKLSS